MVNYAYSYVSICARKYLFYAFFYFARYNDVVNFLSTYEKPVAGVTTKGLSVNVIEVC